MNTDQPLAAAGSLKVKLAVLVGTSVIVAALVVATGSQAGVPIWITVPVTVAAALGVTQWLARGMTAPLREMTAASRRLAAGDYSVSVAATGSDEVAVLARSFSSMAAGLAAADEQQRRLVATVSHELRTPLAAQQALLENLADAVTAPDPAALEAVLAQSERLGHLVETLLDVSRVDGRAAPLTLVPTSVAELVEAGVAEARLGAAGRDVAIDAVVEPADLTVTADPARLAQVVVNLLHNAVRHTPSGGRVKVTAGPATDPAHWRLTVTDQGPGLDPELAARGFDRFGAGADSGGGSGLGLAIAGWATRLHGGQIRVLPPGPAMSSAAPNPPVLPAAVDGTTVEVILPRRPDLTPPRPQQPTPEATVNSTPALPQAHVPATTATDTTGGPPFIDSVFGSLWPEPNLPPKPWLVVGSLLIGLLAAAVVPYHDLGLGLFVVLLLGGMLIVTASRRRREPFTLVCLALAIALGLVVILRGNDALGIQAVAAAAALTAVAVTGAQRLTGMLASGVAWIASGLRGLPLLGRTLSAMSSHRMLWPILRTGALSVVVLVVFGSLFASADAVFGSWAGALIPDLAWDGIVLRGFVLCFIGGVVLAGCYLAVNPPAVDRMALPTGRPVGRDWEWRVPLGLVIATMLGFLAAQGAAVFGGHGYVERTTGLTYADYVHQGFGQLTVATALTLIVVALVMRVASVSTSRDRLVLRLMLGLMLLLTLLIVVSALHRMALYQQALGYTTLRVFVDGFELWLGLLIVAAGVWVVRLRPSGLARVALISGAVFTLVFGMANPDAWVARANLNRYADTGQLDRAYLASLLPDAAGVVAGSALSDQDKSCLLSSSAPAVTDGKDTEGLWAWNLGRARLRDAQREHPLTAGADCGSIWRGDSG